MVQNKEAASPTAYFVVSQESPGNPRPDFTDVAIAQSIVREQGPFPDVDLIVHALRDHIVKNVHKALLSRHLGAHEPPTTDFFQALETVQDELLISSQIVEAARTALDVNWLEYNVYDAQGRLGQVDEQGNHRLSIFTEDYFDIFSPADPRLAEARAQGYNAFIYQSPMLWINNRPRLRRPVNGEGFITNTVLGMLDETGSFEPGQVISQHPL